MRPRGGRQAGHQARLDAAAGIDGSPRSSSIVAGGRQHVRIEELKRARPDPEGDDPEQAEERAGLRNHRRRRAATSRPVAPVPASTRERHRANASGACWISERTGPPARCSRHLLTHGRIHRSQRASKPRPCCEPPRSGRHSELAARHQRRHREHQLLRLIARDRRPPAPLRADPVRAPVGFAQLPFYLQLMKHLAAARPGSARSAGRRRQARSCSKLNGKPAAHGQQAARRPSAGARRCSIANRSARRWRCMHLARARTSRCSQPNLRGLVWWTRDGAAVVLPYPRPSRQAELLLSEELAFQQHVAASAEFAHLHAELSARPDPRRPVPRQRDVRARPGRGPRKADRLLRLLFRRLSTPGCSTWRSA